MAVVHIFGVGVSHTLIPAPPLPTPTPVAAGGGEITLVRPGAKLPWATSAPDGTVGFVGGGPWSLLKNSIFMQPSKIDLGLVLSPSTHAVRIWSLYESPVTSPSVAVTGAKGITISGTTENVTLHPVGGFADYTINVTMAVSGVIDAKFRWNFNGIPASLQTLSIEGQRIVVYGIPPQNRITEELSWRTEVIKTLDSTEQRIRIRTNPQVRVKFKALTNYQTTQASEAMVYRLGHEPLAIPVWHEGFWYKGVIAQGATTINMDTTGSILRAGDLLLLWKDFFTYETVPIKEVSDTALTLSKPITSVWSDPLVLPLAYGLVNAVSYNKHKVKVAAVDVDYTRNDTLKVPEQSPFPLYDGLPVYTDPLYVSGKTTPHSYSPSASKIDFGIKARKQEQLYKFPDVTRDILVKMESQQAAIRYKKLLAYLGGRQKPFWYVSNWEDFLPVLSTTTSEKVLRVQEIGFVEYYVGAETRKWLAIKQRDGGWHYRKIVSAEKGTSIPGVPKFEAITIDTSLPFEFSRTNVERMCLMVPVRLDQDSVSLRWESMKYITSELRVVEVTK
ncbi:hypothetical protein [Vibrio phage R01]|nr:hypothetical protein [Vibrio phage R01]